jgi:phospholipid/cholesterol/gamma-HCH transport system substrate-binding protein
VCSSDLETRAAVQKAGFAAEEIGKLSATTNAMLSDEGRPLLGDLRKSIQSANASIDTLNQVVAEAKPGVQVFSKQTMPEVGLLIRDLREMSRSFRAISEKLDQQGAGSLLGSPPLPDYKP